jgi:thiamine biosynthesis protein ThiS
MPLLILNGEFCKTVAVDLEDLFSELGLHSAILLVEYNGVALHRSEWPSITLSDNDRLELLTMSAGG